MTNLTEYFVATALTAWAALMLVCLVVMLQNVTAISTTNLLLVLIISTMSIKMLAENANDVIAPVTDAAMTLLNMKKGE